MRPTRTIVACVLCSVAYSFAGPTPAFSQQEQRIGSEFIPVDAVATIIIDVAEAMRTETLAMSPVELADAWGKETIGIPASQIKRIRGVVATPGPGDPMFGAVLSLAEDIRMEDLNPELIRVDRKIDVDGHECYPIAAPMPLVMHIIAPKTILIATENYVDTMLRSADRNASRGPLARLAEAAKHTGQLSILMAVEPIRPMVSGILQSQPRELPPPFARFGRVPQLLDAALLRLDLNATTDGIQLSLLAVDESKASELKTILVDALEMGRQIGLARTLREVRGEDAVADATRKYAERVAQKLVASVTPTQSGRRLVINGSASQGMAVNGVLVALLMPAIQAAQRAAESNLSSTKLKQIGLAMHNYHAAYKHFPGDIVDDEGQPLLSWRVALLPFLGEEELYRQFRLNERWDSPTNRSLIEQMPNVYQSSDVETKAGTTVFQRPRGESFVFAPGQQISFRNITDGTANTIAALETVASKAIAWTQPADIEIDPAHPKAFVIDDDREGFHVMLADGAVLFLSPEIDSTMFHHMLTRSGGVIIER